MAIRSYYITDDNLGSYGKIIATGINEEDIFIPTGKRAQYGIVNFSKSYIRNPYYFGNSNINLYRLIYDDINRLFDIKKLNTNDSVSVSVFDDCLVFADKRSTTGIGPYDADYSSSFCKTMPKNRYFLYNSTGAISENSDQLIIGSSPDGVNDYDVAVPVDQSLSGNYGYDMYLLHCSDEQINGSIFTIIRGDGTAQQGKDPFGTSGASFSVTDYGPFFTDVSSTNDLADRTKFSIGSLNATTGNWASVMGTDIPVVEDVQSIVFVSENADFVPPDEYDFEIEDDGDMFLTFTTALTAAEADDMCIVLVRNDSPDVSVKFPDGFAGNGFYATMKNISYSIVEMNYRSR